jgi:Peptidase M66
MNKKLNVNFILGSISTFLAFFVLSAHAAKVTFNVAITASGDEEVAQEQRTYGGHFPYFEIRGGALSGTPRREETVTFCLPPEASACTIDTSRAAGKGGPGYGISVSSLNSPGGDAHESYTLTGRCLTSTVSVQAKRLQRGWYEGDHQIFVKCPVRKPWSYTETQGPFTLDSNDGYSYITNYSGPIGTSSGINATVGYKVAFLNKTPTDAAVTSGMFQSTPANGRNGPALWALHGTNDLIARSLEVSQGVQNLQNDMPLVAGRRTYARFYVSATNPVTNINAQLRAFRNGAEISGSPINAENEILVRTTGIDRNQLNHAFLFKLPYAWTTTGAIEFRATVGPDILSSDVNSANNVWSENLNFQYSAASTNIIVDVPLRIHQDGDKDKPFFIYESSAPTYYPIVNNLLRMHPLSNMARQDCGIKPLNQTFKLGNWDISNKDHWSRMVDRVAVARATNGCGVSGSYWHGMVHPSLNNRVYNGIANSNDNGTKYSSVVFMSGEMGSGADAWQVPRGVTFAHELGHNKGLDHLCTASNAETIDGSYPYNDTCEISRGSSTFFTIGHDGYFLLDVYHDFWGINEPTILRSYSSSSSDGVYPMMSYLGPRWISPYSYCKLLNHEGIPCNKDLIAKHLPKLKDANKPLIAQKETVVNSANIYADRGPNEVSSPPVQPLFGKENAVLPTGFRPTLLRKNGREYLFVSGLYDVTKSALDVFNLMKMPSLPGTLALEDANTFQTELLQRNTTIFSDVLVLNQYRDSFKRSVLKADIVADLAGDTTDSNSSEKYISQFVEAASGATYFELAYGTHIVASSKSSANAPTLTVTPFIESSLTADSVIRWVASDVDSNTLTFSVYYRRNANESWRLIDTDITGDEYRMRDNLPSSATNPLSYYGGSASGVFRVVAYDGFHTTAAESNAIQVPFNAPVASIMQQDGLAIKLGQSLYLNGQASDIEDGPIPSLKDIQNATLGAGFANSNQLKWTSSINGTLGYGAQLMTRTLSRGIHTITLSATDSQRMVGTATVRVSVGMDGTNIAPTALVSASSSYCPSGVAGPDCYFPSRINDLDNSTALGGDNSWTNDLGSGLPQWIQLQWPKKMVITGSELYTSEGYPIQDYDLQYWNGVDWISFVTVTGNNELHNIHNSVTNVVTDRVRMLGRKGPNHQLQYVRVNELIIKGYPLN